MRSLHISGQVGVDREEAVLAGFDARAEQAWRSSLVAVLDDSGMGVGDILKRNTFLLRRSDVPPARTTRDAALRGARPACTLFVAAGRTDEAWLVETEATSVASSGV
jgi:enamine deaminase RidA (YjgF/YER057c/UK114 family)